MLKRIAGILIILIPVSFILYLGIQSAINGLKTYEDLNYAEGKITDVKIVKNKKKSRFKTTIQDVWVLSIEGTDEQFGFLESTDAFKQLLSFRTTGKLAKIYFDKSGGRIENNVTLHIFDLSINDVEIVDLSQTRKVEWIYAVICLALSIFFLTMIALSIRNGPVSQ